MKKHAFSGAVASFVFLLFLGMCFLGCSKDDSKKSDDPKYPVITYGLSGRVLTGDGGGLSGAAVTVSRNGAKVSDTLTDSDGYYAVTGLSLGTYSVGVVKSGYTYGQSVAVIKEDGAIASPVVLTALASLENRKEEVASASRIKDEGVTVQTQYQQDAGTGGAGTAPKTQTAAVVIPKDTEITIKGQPASGDITIAVSPLKLEHVPPAPQNELQVASVILEPADAKFSKPVDVEISLDIPLPADLQIPVKKYENGQWKDIGVAVTDDSGKAKTQVTEFGQIAIQPVVRLETQSSAPVEAHVETRPVPGNQNIIEVEVRNEVSFPNGLPSGITADYALSLIERQKGVKIGSGQKLVLEMPTVKDAAKQAAVTDANKIEAWVQECEIKIFDVETEETITLRIEVSGTTYSFDITFRYKGKEVRTSCTRRWIDHNQGNI